jgi:hypothetical protein
VFYNVGFVKVADVTAIFTDFEGLLVICSPRKHVTEVLCPDFHLLCSGTGNLHRQPATGLCNWQQAIDHRPTDTGHG